jgi:site-specific recombinase XerD
MKPVRDNQTIEAYRKTMQNFEDFSEKSAQDILAECNNLSENSGNNYCAQLLLAYTAYLQKSLPPNVVRQQINVIRAFFSYYKIPIGFGVRTHLQFFLK